MGHFRGSRNQIRTKRFYHLILGSLYLSLHLLIVIIIQIATIYGGSLNGNLKLIRASFACLGSGCQSYIGRAS